jgi:hypothetical protein
MPQHSYATGFHLANAGMPVSGELPRRVLSLRSSGLLK